MISERQIQIDEYKDVKSAFVDYRRFEGEKAARLSQQKAFIKNEAYTPDYRYLKLDTFHDDTTTRDKKTAIYNAVLELEAAKTEPGANVSELEIYAGYHERSLKKILLVEAARDVAHAGTSAEREVATQNFMKLNVETYGEFNNDTYMGMLSTEIKRANEFTPFTSRARAIKEDFQKSINGVEISDWHEQPPMSLEKLQELQAIIFERYAAILEAVPDTDDDVYYDAEECARIMTAALEAGGLAELGWRIVIDPNKSNPATDSAKRIISLPSDTRRNASELRRLIIHEQEVHARRGENGRASGFKPLKGGTANYADVEEGLGVLLECAIAGNWDNPSFNRARDRYITTGLALGIDGTPRDARQVYETLWRALAIRHAKGGDISEEAIDAAKVQAYLHVENAFRGTRFWMRGVIYTKLKVYYEGLHKNAEYISEADDINAALDDAMIGKHNHTDPIERSDIRAVLNKN